MTKNKLTVYKSNKVIEAAYKLSLNEHRLILSCVAKVKSSKPLSATESFEVTAKEFSAQFGIGLDKAYQTLKEVSEQLFERYVVIDNPDPKDKTLKYTKTRWVSSVNYHPDTGKVSLIFAPFMIPYLSELEGKFTFYLIENISKMSSIYAIRLYELLMQWKTTGKREIEIDWLKQQFQIEDKYSSIKDLKKYVVDPAVKDINTHSDYTVSWTQRKTGRNVTHLTFMFGKKPAADKAQKPASTTQEPKIFGVPKSDIEKHALPGDSWQQAAERAKAKKMA
jgi:plasmid replication initiation protein